MESTGIYWMPVINILGENFTIILSLDNEILKEVTPYYQQYELLQTIPGIKSIAAAIILSEIEVDMNIFPTSFETNLIF
ncbi:MAG: transposase [Arachidicoccus sp.]|nr:transposase [Arachidicoccus sp.]